MFRSIFSRRVCSFSNVLPRYNRTIPHIFDYQNLPSGTQESLTYTGKTERGLPKEDMISSLLTAISNQKEGDLHRPIIQNINESSLQLSFRSFYAIISALCRFQQLDDAVSFYELRDEREKTSVAPIETIIICACKQDRDDVAISFLDKALHRRLRLRRMAFNSILRVCYRKKKYTDVLHVFKIMKLNDRLPDAITVRILFEIYREQKDVDNALSLLDTIRQYRIETDVHLMQNMLELSLKYGGSTKTLAILETIAVIHGTMGDLETYNTLIKNYSEQNQIRRGFQALQEMINNNIAPNAMTYQHLIVGCRKEKDYENAVRLFEESKKIGHVQTPMSYTSIIDIYGIQKNPLKAENMFNELLEQGNLPSIITFNTLIRGFCRNSLLDKAFEIMDTMKKFNVENDITTHNNILEGLLLAGKMDAAFDYFNSTKGQGVVELNSATYNILFRYCSGVKEVTRAVNIFKQLRNENVVPHVSVYNSLMYACSRIGWHQRALSFFKLTKQNDISDKETYKIIAISCMYGRKYKLALKLLHEMPQFGLQATKDEYHKILKIAHQKSAPKELIEEIVQTMRKVPHPPLMLKDFDRSISQ